MRLPQGPSPGMSLRSALFDICVDPHTGGVSSISNPSDPAHMNWISNRDNAPWRPGSLLWGVGYTTGMLHRCWWDAPRLVENKDGIIRTTYQAGHLEIIVSRSIQDEFLEEYTFRNTGSDVFTSGEECLGTAIVAPFNDNYTDASDVLAHRAHAHIWCGESSSWVNAMRMGGRSPHLGLVLTQGSLWSYSVMDRNEHVSSNSRGTILLHPEIPTLNPGQHYTLAWKLFWHTGWSDFFRQAQERSKQFVRFHIPHLTLIEGEELAIRYEGQSVSNASLDSLKPGSHRLLYNSMTARICTHVVSSLDNLIAARVRFITSFQQCNDPSDALFGAYLVYDTERQSVVKNPGWSDHNEGRERIGMGVLIARYLRGSQQQSSSLERYYQFVSTKLQNPDGSVRNSVASDDVRTYNFPWVAEFHLEMALLTGRGECLDSFVKTITAFYAHNGGNLYAIGLPIFQGLDALKRAGRDADHDRLLQIFLLHGERIATNGTAYPTHEVNYEQSIVAPAAIILLELGRVTQDRRWLEAAKVHLNILELFSGFQPDHHLFEISIRHWDGYWFGKRRFWGDTFPHHWSVLTAVAYANYYLLSKELGEECDYAHRAETIVRNNLSLFTEDGQGSAAHVYPASVNGQKAAFNDPYCNDQDWALATALRLRELGVIGI